MDREIIITHYGDTRGLFVENESFRTASWDELINSLDKFSADCTALRKEGNDSVTKYSRLKLIAEDGKIRLTDVADPETLLLIHYAAIRGAGGLA